MITSYVRFDSSSVPPAVFANNVSPCISLKHIAESDYIFSFDAARFTHAQLLLGRSPSRFGSDLTPHLLTVIHFFKQTSQQKFIVLNFGSSDFKRRHSEDLGVAMASLLMVDMFGVDWKSICQIPENRKLVKKRPDFEGFNRSNDRFLFEAKGTCRTEKVVQTIEKALEQVKGYPEPALQKIAIASYFCSNSRAFPSFTFFADPELPDILPPDFEHAKALHFEKVLEYCGCKGSASLYLKYLSAKFSLERKSAQDVQGLDARFVVPTQEDSKVSLAYDEFRESLTNEMRNLESIDEGDVLYLTQRQVVSIEDKRYECVAGVASSALDTLLQGGEVTGFEDICRNDANRSVSKFSDGTVFILREKA